MRLKRNRVRVGVDLSGEAASAAAAGLVVDALPKNDLCCVSRAFRECTRASFAVSGCSWRRRESAVWVGVCAKEVAVTD